jgi:thioredoxin reductase
MFEMITSSGVTINHQGERSTLEADTIVLALGHEGNKTLTEKIKDIGIEFYVIGDCSGVGKLPKAIKEGFKAGSTV